MIRTMNIVIRAMNEREAEIVRSACLAHGFGYTAEGPTDLTDVTTFSIGCYAGPDALMGFYKRICDLHIGG